ncbi:symmetrical bis(5'-nucleosyl)-tetraphosphatase [Xylophilus rhododendri]|uniref:Bis(5'-nucleosyl)-tetraphosphatase, symmetrical n=1 Tax=Xylophilus rhododendri TaxID=2697032 RepID=A0A857J4C0_9BURK|nr:symmetrical bis(5'-nucleosyl)-tetraphosphatase [Xylophilus rhododendri]QHI98073.1 symmetrical bis(5'-nucleosyl)-tetraphosphatase [Xylophilus rhododendri]
MAIYLMGDLQGCEAPLAQLLQETGFSPSRDTLYVLGDLVNRGPDSAGTLRRLAALGDAAHCLLGNHDLHLLAVIHGVRKAGRRDTLADLLAAPDLGTLTDWLRHRRMAMRLRHGAQDILMVHAGVLPDWDAGTVQALAAEVEAVLRDAELPGFLKQMYGDQPDAWRADLRGADRLRVIVNALTRLRFCSADGRMDFGSSDSPEDAPPGLMPWFEVPGRKTAAQTVAFGHWSQLGLLLRPGLMGLDTGCVWGGCLSAVRLGPTAADNETIQLRCPQAQAPG